jgi:hypothetical protein
MHSRSEMKPWDVALGGTPLAAEGTGAKAHEICSMKF